MIATGFAWISNTPSESIFDDAQNCKASLSVEKDRNFKSADQDGASFVLILENKSNSSATYTINTRNLETACYGKNKPSASNVSLQAALSAYDSILIADNEISLEGGEEVKFEINVTIPEGTPINSWSCIEVEAIPQSCASPPIKTTLSVFVPNPSEG